MYLLLCSQGYCFLLKEPKEKQFLDLRAQTKASATSIRQWLCFPFSYGWQEAQFNFITARPITCIFCLASPWVFLLISLFCLYFFKNQSMFHTIKCTDLMFLAFRFILAFVQIYLFVFFMQLPTIFCEMRQHFDHVLLIIYKKLSVVNMTLDLLMHKEGFCSLKPKK